MCTICHNSYPNCPVCSDRPTYNECPECEGTGTIYFDEDGNTLTQIEFMQRDDSDCEDCEMCNGSGEIEEEPIDYETFMNI